MPLLSPYFTCSRAYLIGIQEYEHLTQLSTPVKDVQDLAACLELHEFSAENITVSIDSKKAEIEELVAKMLRETGPRDRVIFYFAGHGIAREEADEPGGFLIPVDAAKNNEASFITMRWLLQEFAKLNCKHFLLILDCCFAGAIRRAEPYRTLALDLTKKLYREKFDRYVDDTSMVRQVLTSSSNEEALDKLLNIGVRHSVEGNNSPFAYALIKLLKGNIKAPHHFEDGIITTTRMYDHIDQALEKIREEHQLKKMQAPYYFPLRQNIRGQFVFLLPQKGKTVITALPNRELNNPYKGLSSFETADSHLFFGRKNALNELKALHALNRVLLVSGASGVGKSSLIQAGFIPLLDQPAVILRPGNIRGTADYLEKCATQVKSTNGAFLLFADQFEEMVTVCTEAERMAITAFIQENLKNERCKVIISIRSDFESQLKDNELIRLTQHSRFVIPPFSRDEIEDIIVQPANQAVIQIESDKNTEEENDKFINRIVDEVMQSPGSLPLLSFALQEWYLQSGTWVLKESQYKGIGGVSGALSTIIEKFSAGLKTAIEMECLQKLLLRMVSVKDGQPARKKVYANELQFDSEEQTAVIQGLLSKLIELRIISTNPPGEDGQQQKIYYEPVHDSLLTSWKQLWQWINTAGALRMAAYQQLTIDTKEWMAGKINRSGKLWGERQELQIVRSEFEDREWADNWRSRIFPGLTYGKYPTLVESKHHIFNTDESAFIRRSIRKLHKNKSLLLHFQLAIPILLAIVIIALISTVSRERKSRAYALTTIADNIREKDNMQALRVMHKAFGLTKPDSILNQKMEEIWQMRGGDPFYLGPFYYTQMDEFVSPDGKYIAFATDTLIVFEFSQRKVINKLEEVAFPKTILYSPINDSMLIIMEDHVATVTIWNFITDTILLRKKFTDQPGSIRISGNNLLIDTRTEITLVNLSSFISTSYSHPLHLNENENDKHYGFLGAGKFYYLTDKWMYILDGVHVRKDSIQNGDSLFSAITSNKHILLQSNKQISLFDANGKHISTLLKSDQYEKEINASFSPDGHHILLQSSYAFGNYNSSLWTSKGEYIKSYPFPAAKFSITGQYIILYKWTEISKVIGSDRFVQSKRIESLDGKFGRTYNGLLLSNNDQYLISLPDLKLFDLKKRDSMHLEIRIGKTDSIKETAEETWHYSDINMALAGTVMFYITDDSKYLMVDDYYKDSINEITSTYISDMHLHKLSLYNFSTTKQMDIFDGNKSGDYEYVPFSELLYYRDRNLFIYWDLNYLMQMNAPKKLKKATDIFNYLDSSKHFPPLNSLYQQF